LVAFDFFGKNLFETSEYQAEKQGLFRQASGTLNRFCEHFSVITCAIRGKKPPLFSADSLAFHKIFATFVLKKQFIA